MAARRRAPPPMPRSGRKTPSPRRPKPTRSRRSLRQDAEVSDQVKLDAPEIAENGAVVPIAVIEHAAERDLDFHFGFGKSVSAGGELQIPPGTSAMVANRLKMAKTSKVIALVESGRQNLQRDQRSQSHGRRLRRLTGKDKRQIRWHRQFASARSQAAIPPKSRRWCSTRWIPASSRMQAAISFRRTTSKCWSSSTPANRCSPPVGTGRRQGPLCQIRFKGGQKGDDLTVSWVDNKGQSDSLVGKIQ